MHDLKEKRHRERKCMTSDRVKTKQQVSCGRIDYVNNSRKKENRNSELLREEKLSLQRGEQIYSIDTFNQRNQHLFFLYLDLRELIHTYTHTHTHTHTHIHTYTRFLSVMIICFCQKVSDTELSISWPSQRIPNAPPMFTVCSPSVTSSASPSATQHHILP